MLFYTYSHISTQEGKQCESLVCLLFSIFSSFHSPDKTGIQHVTLCVNIFENCWRKGETFICLGLYSKRFHRTGYYGNLFVSIQKKCHSENSKNTLNKWGKHTLTNMLFILCSIPWNLCKRTPLLDNVSSLIHSLRKFHKHINLIFLYIKAVLA